MHTRSTALACSFKSHALAQEMHLQHPIRPPPFALHSIHAHKVVRINPLLPVRTLTRLSNQPIHLEPIPLPRPVNRKAHIRARKRQSEENKLHEKPAPAAALAWPFARHGARRFPARRRRLLRRTARVLLIQVMCPDRGDVVVVGEFAGFGAEAEVCDGRDFEVWDLEAGSPFVDGFVLQLELEVLVLEVGQAGFGWDLGVADAAGLGVLVKVHYRRAIGLPSSRRLRWPCRRCPCHTPCCHRRSWP